MKKVSKNIKEYTFEPLFNEYKEMDIRFNEQGIGGIVDKVLEKGFIFLVGESGIGKTYSMNRIMNFCLSNNLILPIFLSSEIFMLCENICLDSLIRQAYSKLLTVQEIEMLLDEVRSNKECLILIDAINEVNLKTQKNIISFVLYELNKNNKIILSGQKLLEEIFDIRIKNRMYIMEVTQSNIHEEILRFAYMCLKNYPEKIKKLDYIENVDNTLIGILIVYYLDKSNEITAGLTDLFKKVIVQILMFRNKNYYQIYYQIDYLLAMDMLSNLTYWHYINEYQITRYSLSEWYKSNIETVSMIFKEKSDFFEWIIKDSIFKINDDNLNFIHEKLGDFLVAYKIFNILNFGNYEEILSLKVFSRDVTIKISSFLTDYLLYGNVHENLEENLKRIYLKNRTKDICRGIINRQQVVFYLGILGNLDIKDEINTDSKVVKRAYIVGKAISGIDINGFNNYCHILLRDENEKKVNLCYTLIHQGDYLIYNEKSFEIFDTNDVICENAFKGMIKQLLKQEYKRIDILAIITINDYYSLYKKLIDDLLKNWYNWNHSIKNILWKSIVKLENIYMGELELSKEISEFKRTILKDI